MSWHRTYRPRQIKDLHLESVRETLLGLMSEGKIPQALLFAGPKGTGKTSASRIIAAVLNDENNADAVEAIYLGRREKAESLCLVEPDPDSELTKKICAGQSFAVQEIDAASHGLVDDVRTLKERAILMPQEGRMAVYILDEAHMMSTAAFNAFLKLLEEPPAHAVFILATTELHKIPATIASRCLLVQFRKATDEELQTTLEKILSLEKVDFKRSQLQRLAIAADGSFRDAVKLLELSVKNGQVDEQRVDQLIGGSNEVLLQKLVTAVVEKQGEQVLQFIRELRERQADQNQVYKALFTLLHQDLLRGYGVGDGQAIRKPVVNQFLIQQLLAAHLEQPVPIAFLALEIALLDIVTRAKQRESTTAHASKKLTVQSKPLATPQEEDEDEQVASIPDVAVTTSADPSEEVANAVVVAEVELPISSEQPVEEIDTLMDPRQLIERWQDFVAIVATKNTGLATVLRMSSPTTTTDGRIEIGVYYRFHQEQLQQPRFLAILEACCREVVGTVLPFRFELTDQKQTTLQSSSNAVLTAVPVTTSVTQESSLATMASEVLL